jgi:glutathione S-transferase
MITVHHIPVCPFSQRLEILLTLKGCPDAVQFRAVDITRPRAPELLALTGGSTALPIAVLDDGTVLRESVVILRYLDTALGGPSVAQADLTRHAVENLFVSHEDSFADAGYRLLMNRDPARREALTNALLDQYARLDDMLRRYGGHGAPAAPGEGGVPAALGDGGAPAVPGEAGATAGSGGRGLWFGPRFGWAETVFTPLFMRFWCLNYYENFELPNEPRFARVLAWQQACMAHPAAQQVRREEIVKLYVDYALGVGKGALPPGRQVSSFALAPHWAGRPWPARDKYGVAAGDRELGLLA